MESLLEAQRPAPRRTIITTSNGTTIRPLNAYCPPYNPDDGGFSPDTVLAVAFSPTDVAVTVTPTADYAVTVTNGTAREYIAIGAHTIAAACYFRCFARRKPGSTGSIAAQDITITLDSVTLGILHVNAAAAGVDPVTGSIEIAHPSGDDRFNLAGFGLVFTFASADADVEVFFELVGQL